MELRERVRVETQGRITIPKVIREKLQIREGSILEVWLIGKDKVVLEVLAR